jgi:hypothetical protein
VTLTGRVEMQDVGPGVLVLVTDDGRRFALKAEGEQAGALRPGQKVQIDGHVAESQLGIGMTGDFVIEVSRVQRV